MKIQTLAKARSFFTLWASQSVSLFGSAMTSYALIIWAYRQQGTASSIALLSVCSYLPSILFCFAAGTLADRWNKKKVLLVCNLTAAAGTLCVLLLYHTAALRLWHLYVINLILSLVNAFQNPTAIVAVSLIAPKKHYVRVSGMQAFSKSLITVLTPAAATSLLAFMGFETVFCVDLLTFAAAVAALLFLIEIPPVKSGELKKKESFAASCTAGFTFLRARRPILNLILFFSFINLLASAAGNSMMPAMILSRTGNNTAVLGVVSSSIGIGALLGSVIVTALKPAKNQTRVIFLSCGLSFLLCDILWAVGRSVWVWAFAAFAGNLPLPFLNANMTAIMRSNVPIEMQGRVFSARDTLQYFTIPVGLAAGGFLADRLFEPFMRGASPMQQVFAFAVGSGKGSGMALIYLITGVAGALASLLSLRRPVYLTLNAEPPAAETAP